MENDKIIQDIIERVIESGSIISLPMEVEFFIVVPSESIGKSLEDFMKELNYKVSLIYSKDYEEWTLYCSKSMILSVETISNEEEILTEIASIYGCKYDGFQTGGNLDLSII